MVNFKDNTLDRLIQEHAIYKQFFIDFKERPIPGVNFNQYIKAKAFDANERIEHLNDNIPYYDPAWENANTVLFPIVIDKVN